MDKIQERIILIIADHTEVRTMRELSKLSGYKIHAICKHTSLLEEKGLIYKVRYADRKTKKVSLTDKGELVASVLLELRRCLE